MKFQKYISSLLDGLIVTFLLFFFSSFGFRDGRSSGWYQQWFPNLNGSSIVSMTFLDSLTGFAVTNANSSNQSYILKTTNGGDNWIIQLTTYPNFNKISFVDQNIGFASAYTNALFKTTDGGLNWFTLSNGGIFPNDMAALNKDTILYVRSDIIDGGVYRTTNGGLSWQALGPTGGSGQPYNIYMFDKNMGFNLGSAGMKKTTNGGVNWIVIPGESYRDIKFTNTLIGWKASGAGLMKKTTNGGINWFNQQLPSVSSTFYFTNLSINNNDSLWMCGSTKVINGFEYGIMFKTTNGGTIWGYQLADTSIKLMAYAFINFVNKNIGWAYQGINSGVHTLVGGSDSTFLTNINYNITSISKDYILLQNYPNPFNSKSKIKYEIKKDGKRQSSNVKLIVYDIIGKEIKTLINAQQISGEYEVSFEGNNLSSGIYFYTLFADGENVDTKKMVLIK